MHSDHTSDDTKRGERKPFEPTPIELRKHYNTLDNLIRARSGELKNETKNEAENAAEGNDDDGFLPPYNSAF